MNTLLLLLIDWHRIGWWAWLVQCAGTGLFWLLAPELVGDAGWQALGTNLLIVTAVSAAAGALIGWRAFVLKR